MSAIAAESEDELERLCAAIAETLSDYRAGEIRARTPTDVERWVDQFDSGVRVPLLCEVDHILRKSYLSRVRVERFLSGLLVHEPMVGPDPSVFWRSAQFLMLQTEGRSQAEMLGMFGALLENAFGFSIDDCGNPPASFVYLDDGVFSGNRVLNDLRPWVREIAPPTSRLDIVAMIVHSGAKKYVGNEIDLTARQAGKEVLLHWRAGCKPDNARTSTTSDVLRPTSLPEDEGVRAYAAELEGLGYPVQLRLDRGTGSLGLFSSADSRHLLEQELLKAGIRLRERCLYFNGNQRPLGNWALKTLGFGTMFATYRNCPNNAPLALWAGDPWIPLLPRRTN